MTDSARRDGVGPSRPQGPPGPQALPGPPAPLLHRRGFLGVAATAGAVAAFRPLRRPALVSSDQAAMVLQVARAGAVFPIDFPSFGEPGPASARATPQRLHDAIRRASPARAQAAICGADALIAQGLLDQPRARLLDGIGELAGHPSGSSRWNRSCPRELIAVAALAVATVSRHFDPDSDDAAELWIDILRELHDRGELAGRVI
jgi:hypothetical protein